MVAWCKWMLCRKPFRNEIQWQSTVLKCQLHFREVLKRRSILTQTTLLFMLLIIWARTYAIWSYRCSQEPNSQTSFMECVWWKSNNPKFTSWPWKKKNCLIASKPWGNRTFGKSQGKKYSRLIYVLINKIFLLYVDFFQKNHLYNKLMIKKNTIPREFQNVCIIDSWEWLLMLESWTIVI